MHFLFDLWNAGWLAYQQVSAMRAGLGYGTTQDESLSAAIKGAASLALAKARVYKAKRKAKREAKRLAKKLAREQAARDARRLPLPVLEVVA